MRASRTFFAWSPVFGLIWAAQALAATPEAPAFRCPVPGTMMITTAGVTVALRDGPPLHCISKINGVETDTVLHLIAAGDEHVDQLRDEVAKMWPLAVGRSHVFYVGLPQEPIVNSITIVERVGIDIPAGHFDTYVIEWSRFAANCGAILDEVDRYYYAPSLAAIVKYEHEYGYGGNRYPVKAARWEALKVVGPGVGTTPSMSRRPPKSIRTSLNQ